MSHTSASSSGLCDVPCPNNCGLTLFSAETLNKHLEICTLQSINCPFKELIGCSFSCPRKEMEVHAADATIHMSGLTKKLLDLSGQVAALTEDNRELKSKRKRELDADELNQKHPRSSKDQHSDDIDSDENGSYSSDESGGSFTSGDDYEDGSDSDVVEVNRPSGARAHEVVDLVDSDAEEQRMIMVDSGSSSGTSDDEVDSGSSSDGDSDGDSSCSGSGPSASVTPKSNNDGHSDGGSQTDSQSGSDNGSQTDSQSGSDNGSQTDSQSGSDNGSQTDSQSRNDSGSQSDSSQSNSNSDSQSGSENDAEEVE